MAPPRLARRRFIGAATAFVPGLAVGANLPSDNGAKGDQRGTVTALVPIVQVASGIAQASRAVQVGKLQDAQKALDAIPATEKPFKRLFDEYSEPVSYKQKYKDSNAFVVYYTKGFDLCGNQPVSGAPDNSSLSHFSTMAWPRWLRRAVRNPHRHAIEQASRRWRGGRRGDSERTVKF